jgi:hypothetical protein
LTDFTYFVLASTSSTTNIQITLPEEQYQPKLEKTPSSNHKKNILSNKNREVSNNSTSNNNTSSSNKSNDEKNDKNKTVERASRPNSATTSGGSNKSSKSSKSKDSSNKAMKSVWIIIELTSFNNNNI